MGTGILIGIAVAIVCYIIADQLAQIRVKYFE
jgi:hypothetical protein